MATRKIRCNLASATFPLLTKAMGRSIVIPAPGRVEAAVQDTDGASQNYTKNTPQPLYVQNYLPSMEGFNSIRIPKESIPVSLPATVDKKINIYILRDELDTRVFYLSDPRYNYIYNYNVGAWVSFPPVTPPNRDGITGDEQVTVAYIKGKTYVCIEKYGIYTYDTKDNIFKNIEELAGVDQYAIKGITSAGPYLILFTNTTIYWSNVNDPLDFVPSLITGAGSTEVLAVKSVIVVLAPVADGFIIYTAHNAVSATVTGDMNTPFTYKEIEDFTGLPGLQYLSYGSVSSSSHIAWTPTGIVEVNSQSVINSFPEATLFYQGKTIEEYDTTDKNIKLQKSLDVLNSKFRVIGGRYITLSYSLSDLSYFTHALVYDIALKRWGKLVFNHIDVFEPSLPSPYRRVRCDQIPLPCNSDTPNFDYPDIPLKLRRCNTFTDVTVLYPDKDKTIAFLSSDGTMHTVIFNNYFDYNSETDLVNPPFIIVGDIQLDRKNMTLLVSMILNNVGESSLVEVATYLTDSDAHSLISPPVSPISSIAYDMRLPGRNHRLHITGNSLLSSFVIEAAPIGER